jgi:hypothetical protein
MASIRSSRYDVLLIPRLNAHVGFNSNKEGRKHTQQGSLCWLELIELQLVSDSVILNKVQIVK